MSARKIIKIAAVLALSYQQAYAQSYFGQAPAIGMVPMATGANRAGTWNRAPGGLNVQAFGAKCDGTTDDSAAINAAINALPVPMGGRIYLPACANPYIINATAITLPNDHQPVIIEGDGWDSPDCAAFGSASWLTANDVRGTVIKVTGTTDGILFAAPTYNQNYVIRDLAIVGPGSGTSKGINFGTSTATYDHIENVFVANFSSGYYMQGSGNTVFTNAAARGNTVGFNMASNGTATEYYGVLAECNATGILIANTGTGTHIYGGLIQANTTAGINISPATAALEQISIDGLWSEANGIGIRIDTTSFAITNLMIANHRDSTATNAIVFVGAGANVNYMTMMNVHIGSTLTLPNILINSKLMGVSSGTLTDNSTCTIRINTVLDDKYFCTTTVVGLPATAATGTMAFVSDAVACTQNNTPAGGGVLFCGVVWNGTAWVAH